MGNRWKPALLLLLLLVSVFHVAQSNGIRDSAHIQETTRKHSVVIRRSSGSSGGGGHGSSTAGGRGGSTENGGSGTGGNGGGASDSNPAVPVWTVPLIGGGGANYRNNGGGRHNHRNNASRRFSFSLPVTMAATLLGAALLANI